MIIIVYLLAEYAKIVRGSKKITTNITTPQEALFKIGYGLYALSAKHNNKDNASIVNSFMQITSAEPFMCVLAVNKQSLTHDMIKESKEFNLSCLTTKAPFELYKQLGFQSGRNTDKISGLSGISRSKNGLIYLTQNTNAFLSFNVTDITNFNSHTLFTAQPLESEVLSNAESVTYNYYHQFIKPKPETSKARGYRCKICNFVSEEDVLPPDYECPICYHGVADFVKI